MTLMIQLVNQARFPLFAMSFILGQIQQASAGSKDFFDILNVKSRVVDLPSAKKLILPAIKKGDVLLEFKHVNFEYEQGKQVLHDINFKVFAKERFALVGESGQGKSTIVSLILRYYEPKSGKILIGGNDISLVTQESLHKNQAVVLQEQFLFSGTILENILYGNPKASFEDVKLAAKSANADEFIRQLPDGYNSLIGERGVKLSGGEKQRIAIARAILKDALLIILDEATSSLDSKSEILVQQGLERLLYGRTSIIIAHRLSTISNADHVLVIEKGRVSQYGAPQELMRQQNGLYFELISLQQKLLTATPEEKQEILKKYDLVG